MPGKDRKKRNNDAPKAWTLPTEETCRKGEQDQGADLRARLARYARRHPDKFPGTKPARVAAAYYSDLMKKYLAAAQGAGLCPTLRKIRDLPMIIVTRDSIEYPDEQTLQEYYASVPQDLRMSIPIKGVDELVIRADYLDEYGDSDDTRNMLVHAKVADPGSRTENGTLVRKVVLTHFYQGQDMSLHPCTVNMVCLYAGERSKEPGPNIVTGEMEYPDLLGIDRDGCQGLIDYLTALSPAQLDWTPDEIDFWQTVVLAHAGHGNYVTSSRRSDVVTATLYSATLNAMAYAIASAEPVPAEDGSVEARKAAARPKYLKPDPFADTRSTWSFGRLLYKAAELPVLADGFPSVGPDGKAVLPAKEETHVEKQEEEPGQGAGGADPA